jgi:hypothetical protein
MVSTGAALTTTTAFAPNGREILVAVNIKATSLTSDTDYFQCTDDHECRQLTLVTRALGTQLWTVPISGGSPQLRWSISGRYLMQLAESESGSEVIAHLASDSSRAVTGAFIITPPAPESPYPVIQTRSDTLVWSHCSTAFFSLTSSTALQEVPTPNTCPIWPGPLSTVSPRLAGNGRGVLPTNASSAGAVRRPRSPTRRLTRPLTSR